jgi:hypothetical protein
MVSCLNIPYPIKKNNITFWLFHRRVKTFFPGVSEWKEMKNGLVRIAPETIQVFRLRN